MFENEIKFINDFTLNKIKDLGPLFTIDKILTTDIHPSIKKYVESEINYLIHQDRKKLIDNSLFDYSGTKISNYFNLIAEEIKKTKKVAYEDIKNIILQAVSFNANFVVRPKWALAKLIFGNDKSVSVNDIQLMLNYTYYFEYLNNVFLAYMAKKKIISISVTEFELIMNKIDRELFTLHQSKLVDNAIFAIADFYNIGGLNKSSVTVEAVESFLKEKNLTELLFKLRRGFPNPARKKIDIDDIRNVLYSAFPIEAPRTEEKESEEKVNNELHFENPLKEVSVAEETLEESSETKNEDLIESSSDEIFQEELPNIETSGELENSEMFDENEQKEYSDLVKDLTPEENNKTNSEIKLEHTSEKEDNEMNISKDEKILNSFTEDIEKNSEEEIIILDEKQEEDLLNFYDNEIEISIDDDELKKEEDKSDNIKEEFIEETELKFEEPSVQGNEIEVDLDDANLEDREKIEFEHEDSETKNLQDQLLPDLEPQLIEPILDKSNFEDMFSFLSKKEIDRIIKNVFNSDSEDFANTIEKMSACNSLDEANEILENIFKYARIKSRSKEAAALSKAATKYFNQAE
jgi:hypothetical protein